MEYALYLVLRGRRAECKQFGPTIVTAGPPLLGKDAVSTKVAERMVASQKQAGYDLLKVQVGLEPEVYEALVAAALKAGIPFAVHATASVGRAHSRRAAGCGGSAGLLPPAIRVAGVYPEPVGEARRTASRRTTRPQPPG